MPGLTAAATLDLWERADHLPPVERAIALAGAVEPRDDVAAIARLPLGRRDERLLRLRAQLTGAPLDATAACPACGERVQFAADVESIFAMVAADPDTQPVPIELDGYRLSWRPPDSDDMAAAAAAATAEEAERILLDRCVEAASGPDGHVAPADLPGVVRAALSRAMAALDPLAELVIGLTCPACQGAFDADLDVAGFVWIELNAHARRVLRDVAALARAFGWTEGQVLALSERRRADYLALVRDGFE